MTSPPSRRERPPTAYPTTTWRLGVCALLPTALLVTVLAGAACHSGPEVPERDPPDRQGCGVAASGPGAPIPDPSGPYYHQVAVAQTADGVTLGAPWQVLDHASVPDGALGPGGIPLIYYVNGADGPVWVARLLDDSANVIGPISLDGVGRPAGVVDPDATRMPDGRIRLAYLSGFGPPTPGVPRAICIADAYDGVHFTVVSRALAVGSTTTDPSLTQLSDGTWLMALSLGQQTILARSSDGMRYTPYDTVGYGGVPEVATRADGKVRLYVCKNGIESYLSADRGLTWTRETTVVPPGTLGKRILCDPSMVQGTGWFVFKTG